MKRAFITVRYDRMKNSEFQMLCADIILLITSYNAEEMHLTNTFRRFTDQKDLLKNLDTKKRKMNQSDNIISLRKRLDEMVSAMLLNIKSLKRAKFEDQEYEIEFLYNYTRKLFENYIHENVINKDLSMNALIRQLDFKTEFYNAYQHLGLLKFTDVFMSLQQQIKVLGESRSADKRKLPAVGITIPSKEILADELRFFLKSIEMTAKEHPEIDYSILIANIDFLLVNSRRYVRNLATRRKNAKIKEELNKAELNKEELNKDVENEELES